MKLRDVINKVLSFACGNVIKLPHFTSKEVLKLRMDENYFLHFRVRNIMTKKERKLTPEEYESKAWIIKP